jgi:hypothetical protein
MKILEVYIHNQSLTGAPIYKKFSISPNKDNVLTFKDLADNDIVYSNYSFDKVNIIKNIYGPIGIFTSEQFKEFFLYPDEEKFINEEFPDSDTALKFWTLEL